jgi:signal transduction histidine kinase
VLSVADQGIGIPPDERDRVFDEFYRAANARQSGREGTGLGLSIVKAIAEAHNGSISVDSELAKGSVFRFAAPGAPT